MRGFRRFALVVMVGLAAACGGRGSPVNDPSAMRGGSDWATPFLGTKPEATAVFVPPLALAAMKERDFDPPSGIRLDSPVEWGFRHCAQADYYVTRGALGTGSTAILVMHGVPTLLDPARPYPEYSCDHCDRERPRYDFKGYAPNGARAYVGHGREKTQLFVLSPSTWILATGVAGERLAIEAAQHRVEPPQQPVTPGSVMDAWAPVESDTFSVPNVIRFKWIRGFDKITMAGISLFPPQNGALSFTFKLVYPSSSDASAASDDLSKLIANGSIKRLSGSDDIVGADSSGSTLLVAVRVGRSSTW
jgi:hypothetical protein